MRILVCRASEKAYVGFDVKEVVGVGQFEVYEIPQKPDNLLGAIVYDGKIYSVVALNALLGGKRVKTFVILKNGFAIGVYDLDGIYKVEEFVEVEGILGENFKRAFMLNGNVVYLLEEKFFNNLPKVPPEIEVDIEKHKSTVEVPQKVEKEGIKAFFVEVDSEKFVLPNHMVKEVQNINSSGKFRYGNIYGFTYYEGNPMPVVWKKPIKNAKWIVVLEGGAIPCTRVQVEYVKFEKSNEGTFALVDGIRYKVFNEGNIGELLRWI